MPDPKPPASKQLAATPGFNDAQSLFDGHSRTSQAPGDAEKTAFREALLHHMAETGVGAAALARATGVSKPQIDKLCQRKSETTNVADAIRLSAYFGKSVEEFCRTTAEKTKDPAMNSPAPAPQAAADHPLWGCMAGTITIPDGLDLTNPLYTDAEMEAFADRKADLLRGLPR
jgi:plasmid maintenance system antidote protein VapI